MTKVVDVKRSISVAWQSERPFGDLPRQSSEFQFMGCRWCLRSTVIGVYYDIILDRVDSDEPLDAEIDIWTFVVGLNSDNCYPFFMKCSPFKSLSIWSCKEHNVPKIMGDETNFGAWTAYCILRSDQPTELSANKNEITLLTSSPDDSPSDLERLSLDFGNLLEQKSFPDVTLRCGSRTFSAHRSILSARSDVFAAMFRNKMSESETGTVDVADVDGEVLDMLLKYVYSGKIPGVTEDTVISLYSAADKYSVHALKKACSDWMAGRLTRENCLDFLLLADVCSDKSLRDRVVTFAAGILGSLEEEAWSSFKDKHPRLAIFVYERRFEGRPEHVQLTDHKI